MKEPAVLTATLLAAGLVGCAIDQPYLLPDVPAQALSPRKSERGFPAIVLRDNYTVRASVGSVQSVEIFKEFLILRPNALVLANLIQSVPRDAFSIDVVGRTLKRSGSGEVQSVSSLRSGFLEELELIRASELKDEKSIDRAILAAFPEVDVGSVLQISISYKLPYLMLFGQHSVHSVLPTRLAKLRIELPDHVEIDWQLEGFRERSKSDGLAVAWLLNHVPARPMEPFSPGVHGPVVRWSAKRVVTPHMTRGIYDSWAKVAEMFRLMNEERLEEVPRLASDELKAKSEEEIPRIVFELVQDLVREETLFWRARTDMRADHVIGRRQASPDDRAVAMFAFLQEAGLNPKLGVVLPPRPAKTEPGQPWSVVVPQVVFGDLVVVVDRGSDPLFLDPACRRCAAGDIAVEHMGRDLLVFTPQSALDEVEWHSLPLVADSGANRWALMAVTEEGIKAREMNLILDPIQSRGLRHWLWEQPRTQDAADDHFRKSLGMPWGGRLDIETPDDPSQPILLRFRDVRLSQMGLAVRGDAIALPLHHLCDTDWMDGLMASPLPRQTDVLLGTGATYGWETSLLPPEGFWPGRVPEDFETSIEGARYERTVELKEGGVVRIAVRSKVAEVWPSGRFDALRSFAAEVRGSCQEELRWIRESASVGHWLLDEQPTAP